MASRSADCWKRQGSNLLGVEYLPALRDSKIGYVCYEPEIILEGGAIDAEYIGQASSMIGAGRDTKEDTIDPAVGVILEVKVGQKVDAGGVLCRLYYTREDNVDEAAQLVEDAFRISSTAPESRELILEVVG